MLILANFMKALADVLGAILSLVMILVVIRAVSSWFSPDPRNALVRILTAATEPILQPVRRLLPRWGGIDWSPLVVIFVIMFLQGALVQTVADYSIQLRRQAMTAPLRIQP